MLANRYVLERQLAMGGMGGVHIARDERLGRRVAVKLLREDLAASHEFVERFRREAHMVAGLNHPNIAHVYDYGQDGRQHFIVMELVAGSDLARVLHDRHRLAPGEAVDIAAQVCAALSAAHRAGVVHRDIKPGNVIIGPDGHVKVTDFGIARALGEAPLTQTGSVMGTAQYLPPEQSRGEPATPASDIYSLGVLLYQMLTGAVPFTGDSPVAVAVQHVSEPMPPPSATVPDMPPALDRVVARATAKRPEDRYASADEMAAALRESHLAPVGTAPMAAAATTTMLPAAATAQAHAAAPGTARLPIPPEPAPTRADLRERGRSSPAGGPPRRWFVVAGIAAAAALVGLVTMLSSEDPKAAPSPPVVSVTTSAPTPTSSTSTSARPTTSATTTKAAAPVVPAGLVGMDKNDVVDLLKNLGYRVETVTFPSAAPKDSVLATVPGAGRPLRPGQIVVLVLSSGDTDRRGGSFVVPDGLVGERVKTVERMLRGQNVRLSIVQIPSAKQAGTVISTWPAAGATSQNGRLLLVVSSGNGDN
jgi:serine/threonine-protein kinase